MITNNNSHNFSNQKKFLKIVELPENESGSRTHRVTCLTTCGEELRGGCRSGLVFTCFFFSFSFSFPFFSFPFFSFPFLFLILTSFYFPNRQILWFFFEVSLLLPFPFHFIDPPRAAKKRGDGILEKKWG